MLVHFLMRPLLRGIGALSTVVVFLLGCSEGSLSPTSGTETNVQGVPCTSNDQCGEELVCLPVDGAAGKVCQPPPPSP